MTMNLGNFQNGQFYDEAARRAYVPIYGYGGYNGADNYTQGELQGYRGYAWAPGMYSDPAQLNGTEYDMLDPTGKKTGTGKWEGLSRTNKLGLIAAPFLAAAGVAWLQGAGLLGGGAGAGGGAAGVGEAGWGMDLGMDALANGGMQTSAMGAGAGNGLQYLDPIELLPSNMGNELGLLHMQELVSPSLASASIKGLEAAKIGSGLLGTAAKYAGPAATALGAVAGAQGQNNSTDQTKKMDPRMDAVVYGDLIPRLQGLLAESLSPETRQGWANMRNVGAGLLSQPVAGNAFNRFYGGGR